MSEHVNYDPDEGDRCSSRRQVTKHSFTNYELNNLQHHYQKQLQLGSGISGSDDLLDQNTKVIIRFLRPIRPKQLHNQSKSFNTGTSRKGKIQFG